MQFLFGRLAKEERTTLKSTTSSGVRCRFCLQPFAGEYPLKRHLKAVHKLEGNYFNIIQRSHFFEQIQTSKRTVKYVCLHKECLKVYDFMTDWGVIVSGTWRIIVPSSGSFLVCLSYSNQSWTRPNRSMTVSNPSSDKNNDSIGTSKQQAGSAPTISNL